MSLGTLRLNEYRTEARGSNGKPGNSETTSANSPFDRLVNYSGAGDVAQDAAPRSNWTIFLQPLRESTAGHPPDMAFWDNHSPISRLVPGNLLFTHDAPSDEVAANDTVVAYHNGGLCS